MTVSLDKEGRWRENITGAAARRTGLAKEGAVDPEEMSTSELGGTEERNGAQRLSSQQAVEAAYRFVASYYDYARMGALLRLLEAISWARDHPDSEDEPWAPWQACIRETLDGAPLPELAPVWDL
jgi:hypothetical protein